MNQLGLGRWLLQPRNESRAHWLFKAAGCLWLRSRRNLSVGTEVWMGATKQGRPAYADVVGVAEKPRWSVSVVELKASRDDFLNGYCHAGHYLWLLCPPGIVDAQDLDDDTGLLVADPSCLRWDDQKWRLHGIEVVKPARRRRLDGFDLEYAAEVIQHIARALTQQVKPLNPLVAAFG